MMWGVFNTVGNRIHLPIFHDHLHPQCRLPLSKQAVLHPLEQDQRLLHGAVSPWGWGGVVALQLLPPLVAHVGVTSEGVQRKDADLFYPYT